MLMESVLMSPMTHSAADKTQPEDIVLLRAFVERRDREAMGKLFERHAHAAYRLALNYLENADDAEDAVQTAFVSILGCADQYQAESSVRVWIMGFVLNRCRKLIRTEKSREAREA